MKPDALVFDLDGTLWDAAEATVRGWNAALTELALPERVDVAGIHSISGRPFKECVERLLPGLRPPSDTLLQALDEYEREAIETSGGSLFPGVSEGVRGLAGRYRLFLVSNCPAWYLEAFLESSGLRECFKAWDCHGSSGAPKAEMLRSMGRAHEWKNAVYTGDTESDEEAAREAGLDFVFVTYGFGKAKAPAGAFNSFAALAEHFLGLPRED